VGGVEGATLGAGVGMVGSLGGVGDSALGVKEATQLAIDSPNESASYLVLSGVYVVMVFQVTLACQSCLSHYFTTVTRYEPTAQ
jgi:hypothetical protein